MFRLLSWRRAVGLAALLAAVAILIQVWPNARVSLSRVGPPLLTLVAAWYVAALFLRGWRWQIILAPVADPPLRATVSALAVGGLASMLGPVHTGTVVRGVQLSNVSSAPVGAALLTAAADRAFDAAAWMLLLLGLILGYPAGLMPLVRFGDAIRADLGSSPIAVAILVPLALGLLVGMAVLAGRERWRNWWSKLVAICRPLLDGRTLGRGVVPTVIIAATDLVVLITAARMLGLELDPSTEIPLWVVIALSRGISTAGRLAPWGVLGLSLQHGLFFATLAALGVSTEQAGVYVLALYAALALSTVVGGAIVALLMVRPSVSRPE